MTILKQISLVANSKFPKQNEHVDMTRPSDKLCMAF